MVQILITFNIRPGLEEEYARFVREVGMPFWRGRAGIPAVRGFHNLSGDSPQIVAEVDCEDLEVARGVLSSSEYVAVLREQAKYVTGRSVWLLVPTGRTAD